MGWELKLPSSNQSVPPGMGFPLASKRTMVPGVWRADPSGKGNYRVGHLERAVAAVNIPQEAVRCWAVVPSDNLADVVDPRGNGTGRAGRVDRGVGHPRHVGGRV